MTAEQKEGDRLTVTTIKKQQAGTAPLPSQQKEFATIPSQQNRSEPSGSQPGRTRPRLFTQHWSFSISLARHAWRFYLLKQDARIDEMTTATYAAWISCYTVWHQLTTTEQNAVELYHTFKGKPAELDRVIQTKANSMGITFDTFMDMVRKSWRLWAEERGLADPDAAGTVPAE